LKSDEKQMSIGFLNDRNWIRNHPEYLFRKKHSATSIGGGFEKMNMSLVSNHLFSVPHLPGGYNKDVFEAVPPLASFFDKVPNVKLLVKTKQEGAAINRIIGANLAEQEWIQFQDCDDYAFSFRNEFAFRALAENRGHDAVVGEFVRVHAADVKINSSSFFSFENFAPNYHQVENIKSFNNENIVIKNDKIKIGFENWMKTVRVPEGQEPAQEIGTITFSIDKMKFENQSSYFVSHGTLLCRRDLLLKIPFTRLKKAGEDGVTIFRLMQNYVRFLILKFPLFAYVK